LIKQRQYTDDKPKTSITTGNLSHEELEAEVERLWLREAFFDASQKLAHLGYCEWDYDNGRIISCTPAYAEIFGMSIEEVIESQSSWQKVLLQIHPEDRDHYTQSYREHMGKGSHEVEYRIFRKDGAIRHLKEVAILRHDKDRVHKEAIGLVQDVTEQAMMRKQIEESAAKLKLAARTAKLGYWHFDEVANEYIDISEEYAEIMGYGVPEFLERFRTLDEDMTMVHPDDSDALTEAYDTLEGRIDCNYRIRHRNGHWIHVREISTDITDEDGNCIESIGTLQDITELTEAQLRAEQANRAKNQFLSRMSHELRTPLNAILGFTQLIQSDSRLDGPQQSKVTAIFNAGQHLLSLIDEVLDLSRMEGGDIEISIEPVSLADSIEECIDLVADLAGKRGVKIDCDLGKLRGMAVEADTKRLKQVFLNLLSNAVKYNRENGEVRIFCAPDGKGQLRLSFADDGPGISPDRIDELFEPFNRLDAESSEIEGTGIGLLITRQLLELMQGTLTVDSSPGEGSTFSVCLRASAALAADSASPLIQPASTGHPVDEPQAAAPRILVAEDNEVNRELFEAQLECLGYSADFASTGSEALALWLGGDYPLLLTDIRMPGMDGNELISRIRALEPVGERKPIIAATASAMEADVQQCLDAGADDVIAKPLMLDTLQQALDNWMPQADAGAVAPDANMPSARQAPESAIDVVTLRQSVGDRIDLQRRLLKTYAEAMPKSLFDIRQAFAWNNLDQLGDFAHRLKSSSSSLGALQIAQICSALESACRENRDAEIADRLVQLQQAAASVEVFVASFCEETGEAARNGLPTRQ
jgi:PAS domain S-box-containing protein